MAPGWNRGRLRNMHRLQPKVRDLASPGMERCTIRMEFRKRRYEATRIGRLPADWRPSLRWRGILRDVCRRRPWFPMDTAVSARPGKRAILCSTCFLPGIRVVERLASRNARPMLRCRRPTRWICSNRQSSRNLPGPRAALRQPPGPRLGARFPSPNEGAGWACLAEVPAARS